MVVLNMKYFALNGFFHQGNSSIQMDAMMVCMVMGGELASAKSEHEMTYIHSNVSLFIELFFRSF